MIRGDKPNLCTISSKLFYCFTGRLSICLDTKSNNVHSNPWVVILRNALTPRPRYIRATPASRGLGALGSGPDNISQFEEGLGA